VKDLSENISGTEKIIQDSEEKKLLKVIQNLCSDTMLRIRLHIESLKNNLQKGPIYIG
jgi:hypothetical protein